MIKKFFVIIYLLISLFFADLAIGNQGFIVDNNSIIFASSLEYEHLSEMPVENVISRRISVRNYDLETGIPSELIFKVLWAAYGYSWKGRTVESFSGYPVIIYVSNETATYKFDPKNLGLTLWKDGDYRGLGGGVEAPIQLYLVLDMNICTDVYWGNAETGCIIQNIYLMANALNLGTVCQYRRTDIPEGLGLPTNEKILYKMPLGYPKPPYDNYQNLIPASRQSSAELPEIQDSKISFEDALDSVLSSYEWSTNPITNKELSQLLWASYGYSYYQDTAENPYERHRTVPSAHAYYPIRIYVSNSSGVYEYLPEQHTLTTVMTEDRRSNIAQISGNIWMSSAPLIIVMAYDDTENPNLQYKIGYDETFVEFGLIAQNVYLESAAWGLAAEWCKVDTRRGERVEAMKQALGLNEEIQVHPLSIITIGHPSTYGHRAEWDEKIYPIETKTNSTILDFNFDQSNRRISFTVSGPSETQGFCNVTIPGSLLWGDFSVFIDENPQTTWTQNNNSTHTSLYFTYKLVSNLNVQITGEYSVPEFLSLTPILILLALMAILFIKKHKK